MICPECGGKRPRLSRSRGFKERLARWFGFYMIRCEDCHHRFSDSVWRLADLFYARCPRCYRMDLGTWDLKYYAPPRSVLIKIGLGAKRFRCEACRCNFVSFRKLKWKSTFRKRPGQNASAGQDQETNGAPDDIEVS